MSCFLGAGPEISVDSLYVSFVGTCTRNEPQSLDQGCDHWGPKARTEQQQCTSVWFSSALSSVGSLTQPVFCLGSYFHKFSSTALSLRSLPLEQPWWKGSVGFRAANDGGKLKSDTQMMRSNKPIHLGNRV